MRSPSLQAAVTAIALAATPASDARSDNLLERYAGQTAFATRGLLGTDGGWLVKRFEQYAAQGNQVARGNQVAQGNQVALGAATRGELSRVRLMTQAADAGIPYPFRVALLAADGAHRPPGRSRVA